MKKISLTFIFLLSTLITCWADNITSIPSDGYQIKSPSGNLSVKLFSDNNKVYYEIWNNNIKVMDKSQLGFVADIADFSQGLAFKSGTISDEKICYDLSRSKTSHVNKQANKADFTFNDSKNHEMTINFVVEDNDIAFRYSIPQQNKKDTKIIKIYNEVSAFKFVDGTTTFLCPQITPMTGWKRSKPSYEEEYTADAPMNMKSQFGVGYTFPCLFKVNDKSWVLVSETGVTSNYCGSRLSDYNPSTGYTINFPQDGENNGVGSAFSSFGLPGTTPWRTITVGSSLKPIVETTIPFDVVKPLYEPTRSYQGGRYTWSWLIWQDNSCNYDDQVTFTDLASQMGYEYILVDALWDDQIGRTKMEQLAEYAKSKNVKLLVWHNSNGIQNDAPQGPRDIMSNIIARKKEMAWLKKLGVSGIKVDFFGGDKQETMRLYEEILSDANDYGIQVIFHGCTLPRGWERMYPNYVASEAALASENVFFSEHHAKQEGFEMTMHPFARNTVGSFDWGGVIMNKFLSKDNKSRHKRYTTDLFEMATAITNQTSINCVALTPQAMPDLTDWEIDYLKQIPTTWDETRFIDGYPTKYTVIARRHGDNWYVAGINGINEPIKLNLNLDFLAGKEMKFYHNNKVETIKVKKLMKLQLNTMDGFIIK
nr:glycoside hydrolase family 97 catalytic domain-containing protein [Prevotella sp.]